MEKRDSKVTETIIRKVRELMADVDTGEEIIDFLRTTEPVFMKEVGRFVQIELNKMKQNFPDEESLTYLGSVIGAAQIMGFLIAREQFHNMYQELVDLDGVVAAIERSKDSNNMMAAEEEIDCKGIEKTGYDEPYAIFSQPSCEKEEHKPTEEEWEEIENLILKEETEELREKLRKEGEFDW